MKYYSLKYVDNIKGGYNGWQRMWRIQIRKDQRDNLRLLEHEKLHVRQWLYTAVVVAAVGALLGWFAHPLLYVAAAWAPWSYHNLYQAAWFRRTMELAGYAKEAKGAGPVERQRLTTILLRMGVSQKRISKAFG